MWPRVFESRPDERPTPVPTPVTAPALDVVPRAHLPLNGLRHRQQAARRGRPASSVRPPTPVRTALCTSQGPRVAHPPSLRRRRKRSQAGQRAIRLSRAIGRQPSRPRPVRRQAAGALPGHDSEAAAQPAVAPPARSARARSRPCPGQHAGPGPRTARVPGAAMTGARYREARPRRTCSSLSRHTCSAASDAPDLRQVVGQPPPTCCSPRLSTPVQPARCPPARPQESV